MDRAIEDCPLVTQNTKAQLIDQYERVREASGEDVPQISCCGTKAVIAREILRLERVAAFRETNKGRTMKLPTSVRIGFKDYTIGPYPENGQSENGNWGLTRHGPSTMFVHDMGDQREIASTVLHEILHGCFHVGGGPLSRKEEEDVTTVLANQLSGVFRDNPELIKWLAKNLE